MKTAILILATAFAAAPATAAPSRQAGPESITYRTGPCMGGCPIYNVTVRSDGSATFEGVNFTAVRGTREFRVTPRQYRAFAAWLDATTGRPAFDYPEITGYALSFLAGRPSLSERAWAVGNRAAAWLVHRVQHGNLAARDGEAVYLFDLAMVASGLLSFGRRAEHAELVQTGHELVALVDRELGSGLSISPLALGRRPDRRAWSTHGLAHLAKLAQSLRIGAKAQTHC